MMDRYRQWLHDQHRISPRQSIASATTTDLLDFADTLPLTYASRMALYSAFTAWWKVNGYKQTLNPASSLNIPKKPEMLWKGLEKEEAHSLIGHSKQFGPRNYAICCLLYYAGLRNEEAAALLRSAPRDGFLHVMGKGLKPRVIPLHERLAEALEALDTPPDALYMFPGRFPKTHISTNTVNVYVGLAGAAAGLGKITPHQLRHTYGGWLVDEFGDLRAAAELLGHSFKSLNVTAGYSRTKQERKREMIDSL